MLCSSLLCTGRRQDMAAAALGNACGKHVRQAEQAAHAVSEPVPGVACPESASQLLR
jgi:hypothetical protein